MTTTREADEQHNLISLTRMIYAFSGGITLYLLLAYSGQFLLARLRHVPHWFDLWYYISSLCFVAAMLSIAVAYRFRTAVFRWDSEPISASASWMKSISLGLLGGAAALIIASPTFWFSWGHRRLEPIQLLIADALSPLRVLNLLFFVFALAVSSEIVFRGIVFRTFARYARIPAAALASCLLFAFFFPVLGFAAAAILSVTSSILYYKTKNLLAPIFANALFTAGGGGIAVYHRFM